MKQIEFEGTTHEFPDDFTDTDIAKALGGGPAATLTAPPASGFTKTYQDYIAGPLTKAVKAPFDLAGKLDVASGIKTPEQAASRAGSYANFLVPQTPLEAGATVGTFGAGGLAAKGLKPGMQALARITGGAVGGEAGNVAEGGPLGKGAAIGGGGAVAGETGASMVSKILRSLPRMKGKIAADDAVGYGQEMGRVSPPLAGAKTAEEMRTLAGGPGKSALGDAKEQIVQQIEALTGNQPLNVPGAGPNPMTLREVNDILSEVGTRMGSKNPLDRTFQGIDQRKLYGQLRKEINAALGGQHPDAPGLFNTAQSDYSKGLAMLKPLEHPSTYRVGQDVQFNTPYLQQYFQNPRNVAALRNKLGDADYEAFLNVLTRGAGKGKDVLGSGEGHMLDAIRQMGRGSNTGFWAAPTALFGRTLTPNIGSQYVGRQPMSLPPMLQQALDVVLQRQAGQIAP